MNKVVLSLPLALALISGATGCQDQRLATPPLEVGKTSCARCSRTITDQKWAAAEIVGERVKIYDEPGCLFEARRSKPKRSGPAVFLDHSGSGTWLSESEAWFGQAPTLASPAGHNWAAFPTFAAAQDAVTEAGSGRIVRFDEALGES